jgi:hypothetical protein
VVFVEKPVPGMSKPSASIVNFCQTRVIRSIFHVRS